MDELQSRIKYNCNVSDSKFWGYFSLCSMISRLKELYLHEHDFFPWQRVENRQVLDWIDEREQLWESLEEKEFDDIKINNESIEPFESNAVNEHLFPEGYIYDAGIGLLQKPTFFLAEIHKAESINGFQVRHVGRELVRDMAPTMATHRNGVITIRREVMLSFIHYKYEALKFQKNNHLLHRAFNDHGLLDVDRTSKQFETGMNSLRDFLVPLILSHELGEAHSYADLGSTGDDWLDMLQNSKNKVVEMTLRAIKDFWADTSPGGSLSFIVENRDASYLTFYLALMDDIRKKVFADYRTRLSEALLATEVNWSQVDDIRQEGYEKSKKILNDFLDMWRQDNDRDKVGAEVMKLAT